MSKQYRSITRCAEGTLVVKLRSAAPVKGHKFMFEATVWESNASWAEGVRISENNEVWVDLSSEAYNYDALEEGMLLHITQDQVCCQVSVHTTHEEQDKVADVQLRESAGCKEKGCTCMEAVDEIAKKMLKQREQALSDLNAVRSNEGLPCVSKYYAATWGNLSEKKVNPSHGSND